MSLYEEKTLWSEATSPDPLCSQVSLHTSVPAQTAQRSLLLSHNLPNSVIRVCMGVRLDIPPVHSTK